MVAIGKNICRICTFKSRNNKPLFEAKTGQLTPIGEMFAECLIEPLYNDGYPVRICLPCNLQLTMFHTFKVEAYKMRDVFSKKIQKDTSALLPELPETVDQNEMFGVEQLVEDCSTDSVPIELDTFKLEQETHTDYENNYEEIVTIEQKPDIIQINSDDSMESLDIQKDYRGEDGNILSPNSFTDLEGNDVLDNRSHKRFDDSETNHDIVACNESNEAFKPSDGVIENVRCSNQSLPLQFTPTNHRVQHIQTGTSMPAASGKSQSGSHRACVHCGKYFKHLDQLAVHLRRHNANQRYICDICGKKFLGYESITEHRKIHKAEKTTKFTCQYCGDTKTNWNSMVAHISTQHTRKIKISASQKNQPNEEQ